MFLFDVPHEIEPLPGVPVTCSWCNARGEVVRSATLAEVVAFGTDEVLPG